ncbi:MAG: MMPL family transporter, partial [Actinomycetota bacterium]
MFDRIADLVLARPKTILGVFLALVVAGGVYGRDVPSTLSPAGYEVGGSESTAALAELADRFDTGPANLVLLVDTGRPGGVDDNGVVATAGDLVDELRATADVADVTSAWSADGVDPRLRSDDGGAALITARIVASEDEVYTRAEEVRGQLDGTRLVTGADTDEVGEVEVTVGVRASIDEGNPASPAMGGYAAPR